jgi:large subunit ribosomal protein L29
MKPNELRQQSLPELEKQLHDLLKEQFVLRMQKGTDQLSRPSQFKVVRRNIARVKTLMAEKQTSSQA